MANPVATPADALIRSADRAGENASDSAMDKAFANFALPSDPAKLGKMYSDVSKDLKQEYDIEGALGRTQELAGKSADAAAGAVFEGRYKAEELAKTPVADLDAEIDRLAEQKWGIFPAIMGRTDILDYGAKMKLATRAEQLMDASIDRLTDSRKRIVDAADARAKDRVEEMRAKAAYIDKQVTAAQNDLNARITLFKDGKASFDDIVQASMELQKMKDAKAKAGSGAGNPFLGMGAGVGAASAQFPPAMVLLFGAYEKTGDFPGVDSSKTQLKMQLTQKYGEWVSAGRPGSKIQVPGAPNPNMSTVVTKDVSDLYAAPAAAMQNNGFFGSLMSSPASPLPAPTSIPSAGTIDDSGEYIPPS